MSTERRLVEVRSLDDPLDDDVWGENVFLIGPPSGGKTTQFVTLPGKKFIYVFDPNCIQALRPYVKGQDIKYLPFIPDVKEIDIAVKSLSKGVLDKTGRKKDIEPKLYMEFERDYTERLETGYFEQFDWVGFDGLTTFSEMIMDRVLYINGRPGKFPQQDDWTAQMNTLFNVVRTLTASRCNTCVMCHVELKKDDVSGKTFGQLVITGRLRSMLPQRFSQIFGCDVSLTSDGARYTAQTVKDKDWPTCRTNIQGLNPIENVTIDFKKDPIGQGVGGILLKAGRVAPK